MARPPLRGYNHNIRYRNRVFHVQTEDSGLDNPHVFSHLFHGGVVISTARTEYADIVAEEGHEPRVQKRMQEQHKSLMKRLRRGEFDPQIVQLLGDLEGEAEAASGAQPDTGAQEAADVAMGAQATGEATAEPAATEEVAPEQAANEQAAAAEQAAAEQAAAEQAAAEQAAAEQAAAEQAAAAQALASAPVTEEDDLVTNAEVLSAAYDVEDTAQQPQGELPPAVPDDALETSQDELVDSYGTLSGAEEQSKEPTDEVPVSYDEVPVTFDEPSEIAVGARTIDDRRLEADLDPASLAAFEQMKTTAMSVAPGIEVGSDTPGIDVAISVGDESLSDVGSAPSDTSEQPAVNLRGQGGGEPPPLPVDEAEPPPLPIGSASELPPLPIEEVVEGSEWTNDESTGRYDNAIRGAKEGAHELPADASAPDLNFKLKLGSSTGRFDARRIPAADSAPQLPEVHVARSNDAPPSDQEALIIDRPDDSGPDDMTTSYSHVRRGTPQTAPVERPAAAAPPQAPAAGGGAPSERPSGMFEKPLPPSASQLMSAISPPQAPASKPAAPRPASTEPRRPSAPRVHAVQGSTPQRYTAPSAKGRGRGRRATGSYEAVRPPVAPKRASGSRPTPARARGATPAAPPRPGAQAPRAPQAVVARPAVVVGGGSSGTNDRRKKPGSGVSIAARSPKVPVAPTKRDSSTPAPPAAPKRPSQQTPRARARNLPNLFGSDLISERSLDEVILHYLAEDGEKEE